MKSKVSPAIIAVAIALVAIFVGVIAYKSIAPPKDNNNTKFTGKFDPSRITPELSAEINKKLDDAKAQRGGSK